MKKAVRPRPPYVEPLSTTIEIRVRVSAYGVRTGSGNTPQTKERNTMSTAALITAASVGGYGIIGILIIIILVIVIFRLL